MRRNGFLAILLFAALSCAAQNTTTSSRAKAYDNFSDAFLSPERWTPSIACSSSNGQSLECVRETAHGKLRLADRNFGQRDSDEGESVGYNAVNFVDPSSIKSITTNVEVQSLEESSCPANPGIGAHANIDAVVFNTGSGLSEDDVGAVFGFGTQGLPPGQLMVFGQILYHGNFAFLFLGTVTTETPVTLTWTWDQPNHQFIVSWTNLVTHVKTEGVLPYYPLSDTTPAIHPSRALAVATFPANCTSNATWVYMDATFDNV